MNDKRSKRTNRLHDIAAHKRARRLLAALLVLLTLPAFLFSCKEETKPDTPYRKTPDPTSETSSAAPTSEKPTEATVAVTGIAFPYKTLDMVAGETKAVRAQVVPENATNQNISYKITDDSVIIYENGLIKAIAEGSSDLIAEAEEDGYRARLTVTVSGSAVHTETPVETPTEQIPVTGVSFPYGELILKIGERTAISAAVQPENATNRGVRYKTTDDSVFSYENGLVTAIAEGKADLIAESADGSFRARLSVTVLPGEEPTTEPPAEQDGWLLKETADAGMDYQNKLIFLGDSTTAGMISYEVLPGGADTKQVWRGAAANTITFLYVENVNIIYPETGESLTIIEAVKKAKPAYLVVTLGVTGGVSLEIGEEAFVGLYEWLLSEIFKASPQTKVIVQSIFPVEKERFPDYQKIKIENIALYNGWIKDLVKKFYEEGKNVRFSDVYPELLGSDGYMDPAYGNGDGLHIGPAGYAVILNYLRTHAWL